MANNMLRASSRFLALLGCLAVASTCAAAAPVTEGGYCVVVSATTQSQPEWQEVAQALVDKHHASVITYKTAVKESLAELRKRHPRYTCFVARPEEAGREFVAQVHQLTRELDDDPYTDTLWGILTGYDAQNALRIAKHAEPLTVRRVASGTELAMEMVEEGVWYCELQKNRMVRKQPGKAAEQLAGPDDTTAALVASLNEYQAQLFVTSGHATERDWQIGFRYRNGSFRCEQGKLFGLDTQGQRHPIDSPNAKVYLPIGNCLMGHINSTDAMALAWMNSAGVHQMIGYTVPTWFGYAGWGCLDYFVEQPGRFTLTEAFFANHHALIHRLQTASQGSKRGFEFDRDVVAFYGDPAWQARMAPGPLAWEQTLTEQDGRYTFTVVPQRGDRSFQPINTNGSQRGYRPIVAHLPHRVRDVEVIEGRELNVVIADDFLLIPLPAGDTLAAEYRLVFRAKRQSAGEDASKSD